MNELGFESASRLALKLSLSSGGIWSFTLGFSAKSIPNSHGLISASKGQWVGLVKIPSALEDKSYLNLTPDSTTW